MTLDDETEASLGYSRDLPWWEAESGAHLSFSRATGKAVVRSRDQWTPDDWRAYRRERKAAWRARRPDLSRDADRRADRYAGSVPMAVHLRRVAAAAMSESQRKTKRRWAARWRARLLAVSVEGFAERVVFGMDVAAREVA